ncbi:MAG: flagellar hook-basal body complex protein [Firmicutes bacterium]|nr:flagellar hook-basal body complex protein [Bacillota bacterium]
MVRAMYSGVSGLKNHQTRMDVIANNIANVNTVAFKSSRVTFQDIYSQTIRPASQPDGIIGGTNPRQIGLGVTVGSIDTMFTQAGTQATGLNLDLAIDGNGFFVLSDGTREFYSRAGGFEVDSEGMLVNANGLYVQDVHGHDIDTSGLTGVTIDLNGRITGLDDDGEEFEIGFLGIAMFANNNGLSKAGGNLYVETANSGEPNIVNCGEEGAGTLRSGELELSNVDLSNEFTDMITTQRGFQANSRIITVADSMLEELVNLKR